MPVRVESPDLFALTRRLGAVAANAPKEFRNTIVSVGRAAKTETTKESGAKYNASTRRIGESLSTTTTSDAVKVKASKKPITLKSFGAKVLERIRTQGRGKRKPRSMGVGVAVTVIKAKGRSVIRSNAFWIAGKKGLPFRRVGKARYPVAPITGPSVADMLKNEQVFTPLQKRFVARATAELDRRITRELARRG